MTGLPLDLGALHFVGIGGIGMSGIAEVLHTLGHQVQGSDLNVNANVRRLRELSIPVAIGHKAENLGDAQAVVISSAVEDDNPEVVAARARHIPVVRRAEMLAELMRFKTSIAIGGTHGKTTTTSLIAAVLDGAGFDPTVINGGIINAYGTNARLGEGEWMVVEADESDGTFIRLPAAVAVVTNIDPEHLDFYGDFEAEKEAFRTFVENIPFYGFAVLCIDHPEVQALAAEIQDRRIVTYGFSPQADVRAENLRASADGATFDLVFEDRKTGAIDHLADVTLALPGRHNVQNALAAIAIARELKIEPEQAAEALAKFEGVKRRFTKVGTVGGITIIDDYAHHPVEIAAVLATAREIAERRVIAVMQPHRYSRLADLFDDFCTCFSHADTVLISDVYAAGETPVPGLDSHTLIEGLRRFGHRDVDHLESPEALATEIAARARAGDIVVCLGAGTITTWAQSLPAELEPLVPEPGLREVGR
jgi:UDP-N-acetylmuramate--alanine ligase